jgi:hypothetical protein
MITNHEGAAAELEAARQIAEARLGAYARVCRAALYARGTPGRAPSHYLSDAQLGVLFAPRQLDALVRPYMVNPVICGRVPAELELDTALDTAANDTAANDTAHNTT